MKIKKCGFLLSLVMLICFALPSFASAEEEQKVSLLRGVGAYTDFEFTNPLYYQGKHSVNGQYLDIGFGKGSIGEKGVYFDLGVESEVFSFLVNSPVGTNVISYKPLAFLTYYDSDKKQIGNDSIKVTDKGNFVGNRKYQKVRYVKFQYYSDSNSPRGAFLNLLQIYGTKPLVLDEIKNLNAVEGINDVSFTWENPSDPLFTGVKIYKEDSLVATVDKNEASYKVDGLEENKNYNFKFIAMYGVDSSKGIEKVVKTKTKPKEPMPLVKPPENVILTPQNGKMVIAWDDVKSPDLEGYNVYIDGKKVNDEPLKSNKLIVKNLENGKSYKVQISAVNKENAEGEKSKAKEDKPSVDALEVEYDVKMPFSAFDLLTSSVSLLGILGGFILLGLAIIWFRPLKRLIVNAVRKEKDKK
ncbi:fibronectin type III domain-containing protein [Bacillus mobilis]|uniref:fibronectin type III domain-containing protein n=3 Tax=Bacillus mobilis TaxID=2026190 RepID=UPI003557A457